MIRTALFTTITLTSSVFAQQRDTVRALPLDALVVTVERRISPIRTTVNSVSVLHARDLANRPARTLAEALQQAPGIAFVDFEGTGGDPQLMLRGFYGGGEAEYALLLLDGQPINSMESGRINWDLIPLSAIESIEIVRGPASAMWGDAAIGGVVNVITRRGDGRSLRGSISGGGHEQLRAAGALSAPIGRQNASFFGHYTRSAGFRDHAERTAAGGNAAIGLFGTSQRGVSLSVFTDWREYDEPGPLTGAELVQSRTQSSAFYRADHADEQLHRVGLLGATQLSSQVRLRGSIAGELRAVERVRSLRLAPEFADTKLRDLSTRRVLASAQGELDLRRSEPLFFGMDASWGSSDSDYFSFSESGERSADANADGARRAVAWFARYGIMATSALRLSLGLRYDWLEDTFEIDAPEEVTEHTAFSPSAGLNLRYAGSSTHQGHLFANITRAFKAPTPDQLYDQRRVPIPFPPFAVSFSNADLKPQKGTNIEAGIYHDALFRDGRLPTSISLSVYQFDLEDEIDFDVSTLGYRNIGKSRHRGIETGITVGLPRTFGAFANYTMQAVTTRAGDNSGNYLKAIPLHYLVAGLSAGRGTAFNATLSVNAARRMYLDDANTERLPDWTRWDARASYRIGTLQLFADVFNIADAKYSSTGFPDPAGSDVVYYYPAAGRMLNLGLSWQR
jgi:outer membrane cobalamin receptor